MSSISPVYEPISATATACLLATRSRVPRVGSLQHPLERGGQEERVLTDPFDYEAEDRLVDAWFTARASVPAIVFEQEPMYGMAYSGPGGRPRTSAAFDT